jgi:hypothetical protein
MHQEHAFFQDATVMIDWLTNNNIKMLPRQLDLNGGLEENRRIYNQVQVQWFDNMYKLKSFGLPSKVSEDKKESHQTDVGRACCGGRQICTNENYKQRHFYLENKFPDWYCSVNHFFLYVKQVNGEVFVNKDCKMNFNGQVGPIGNLDDTQQILSTLKHYIDTGSLPVIQCKKHSCFCGLCAPKAKDLASYKKIMKKYQKEEQL